VSGVADLRRAHIDAQVDAIRASYALLSPASASTPLPDSQLESVEAQGSESGETADQKIVRLRAELQHLQETTTRIFHTDITR
jgi:hypothetical protein